jgi:hypothetical protein
MGIQEQAQYSSTSLSEFLDERLPHRDTVIDSWTQTLASEHVGAPALRGGRDSVGWALELRMGLDLADTPSRLQELSYLPIQRCSTLLTTAGFHHTPVGLPTNDTTDPMLLHWVRTHNPGHPRQRPAHHPGHLPRPGLLPPTHAQLGQ